MADRYRPHGYLAARVDPAMCAASVPMGGRMVGFRQCSRRRADGTEWCRQHSPEAEAARRAAAKAAHEARVARDPLTTARRQIDDLRAQLAEARAALANEPQASTCIDHLDERPDRCLVCEVEQLRDELVRSIAGESSTESAEAWERQCQEAEDARDDWRARAEKAEADAAEMRTMAARHSESADNACRERDDAQAALAREREARQEALEKFRDLLGEVYDPDGATLHSPTMAVAVRAHGWWEGQIRAPAPPAIDVARLAPSADDAKGDDDEQA